MNYLVLLSYHVSFNCYNKYSTLLIITLFVCFLFCFFTFYIYYILVPSARGNCILIYFSIDLFVPESDRRMEQNWCVPLTHQFCTDLKQLNKEVLPNTKHTCSLTSAVELIGSLLNGLGSNAVGLEKCAEHVCVSQRSLKSSHWVYDLPVTTEWKHTEIYRHSQNRHLIVCVCLIGVYVSDVCTWTRPINVTRSDRHSQNKQNNSEVII